MTTPTSQGARGRVVVLAGATSAAGLAATRALRDAGARVITTGRTAERLRPLAEAGAETAVDDATSFAEMTTLADRLDTVDAVVPLVGGWRGGGGLAGQTDDDFAALLPALEAVRATSTAVARPLAGGANYAAVKAASEAWTRAVAQGYAKAAREADEPLRAAAVVFRAKALDPDALAARLVGLWDADAADLNDRGFERV